MSTYLKTVVAFRRIASAASLVQSLIGVAFRNQDTWLLSPADGNACVLVMQGAARDPWGQPAQIQVFQCHVGAYLGAAFPKETEAEVFRIYFDSYKVDPWDRSAYGELLAEYADYALERRFPWQTYLSFEHLGGGRFADRDLLVRSFQAKSWQDLMRLCPESVVGEWTEFLPHPGLAPGDTDLIDEYIAEAKLLDTADRVPAQRIM
jgi:hypothetical protein